MKFIIVAGNIIDGHEIFGTFECIHSATEYAEKTFKHISWWVVELQSPSDA